MTATRGLFVTLEGVDGAGKTTQADRLTDALREAGREVLRTREPGGSPGAEEIRRLLVEGEPGRWSPWTELLLFTAARRDHLERAVRPALARGAVVLCDRFVDSTRAYQTAARGAGTGGPTRADVDALHARAIGLDPDLTLIFDIDPAEGLARGRARGGPERFERLGPGFQTALRDAYRAIAAAEPGRCALIDAAGDPGAVFARAWAALAPRAGVAR
jgi:dTMP kinase